MKDLLQQYLEKVFILAQTRSKNSQGNEKKRCEFITEWTCEVLNKLDNKEYLRE